MQNSYSYSPTMHNGDPYRQPVSMPSNHSISLPPMRTDGSIPHPQAYIPSSQQLSSPPMATYYAPQHPMIYHHQSIGHMQAMPYRGFGIPIPHSRPQKKDIKRRTKTGCMTCRRRRIKCDEQKPVCRNCVKSKRECLGYDPLHKNQPGSGAAAQKNSGCCTTQSQQPSSPAATPAASTVIASSPTSTASTGVTTPTSSMFYPPLSASSSFSSTASFTQPSYSTAPPSQAYASSPVHQAYSHAPSTQSYGTPTLTSYYTLPAPMPSSKPTNVNGYFQSSSPEPLHAVTAGRHLSGMNRSHGVPIY